MAEIIEERPLVTGAPVVTTTRVTAVVPDYARYAYRVLHVAFIVAPTVAGLDKFFHLLVNWDKYLAPVIAGYLPFSPHQFMLTVGVIEIVAGLIVALKPKVGAWIVAAWLAGICLNLILTGTYFDIALRDFGLMLGAISLGLLGLAYDHPVLPAEVRKDVVRRDVVR